MTCFHPWTLNPEMSAEDVHFFGGLCPADKTWNDSLRFWLNGRILTEEFHKYIRNFIVVTRVRPRDTEEEDCSDEQVSDEELVVNKFNFAEVVETRIGGAVAGENEEGAGDDSKDGARQAFAKAREMWQILAQSTPLQRPEPGDPEAEKLQKTFAAVAASQKQEYTGSSKESSDKDPSWTAGRLFAERDI
jgi:hypothetical protein